MDSQAYIYFTIPSLVNQFQHCREELNPWCGIEKWGKRFHASSKFTKGLNVPFLALCLSVIGWGLLHPHCMAHKDLQLLLLVADVLFEPGTSVTEF